MERERLWIFSVVMSQSSDCSPTTTLASSLSSDNNKDIIDRCAGTTKQEVEVKDRCKGHEAHNQAGSFSCGCGHFGALDGASATASEPATDSGG